MADSPYKTTQWRKLRPVIYARDGGRCQVRDVCDGTKVLDEYDVDHIIPWNEGGSWFDPANLRTSCWACNRRRGTKRMQLAAKINRATFAQPSRDW